ncbi:hypothetical protein HK099_007085 [Clydaea vesicula]|uniref:Queuosine 5'-phosphate N-glycosylase/hydrolase n=1 Tax=Clydaea vesicula TaxID=447962 RepID=A0AAD5U6W9_9FUNG|nr:hypothetical protein HK099_007085 [Clydaea vesicula]
MSNKVLISAEFVSNNSKNVFLGNDNEIEKAASFILKGCENRMKISLKFCDLLGMEEQKYSPKTWRDHKLHPQELNFETVDFIFFLDLMNFSFWSESDVLFTVKYKGVPYTGYWSLCALIHRSLDEGKNIINANFMKNVTREELKYIFRSDTECDISLFEERLKSINDAGKILVEKFDGTFVNVIKLAEGSCKTLIQLVCENFYTFNDTSIYQSEKVYIYKRVQILVADLWACFEGAKGSPGYFYDLEEITMFADYRVPQALIYLGLIKYSNSLLNKLRLPFPENILEKDSELEIEIRMVSIWSVEMVKRQMVKVLKSQQASTVEAKNINSILIDFYIWDLAKRNQNAMKEIPIHKCRTVFY